MVKCCVSGCNASSYSWLPEIAYHRFPTLDKNVRQQWFERIGISPSSVTDSIRVCSAHFKKEDYPSLVRSDGTRCKKTRLCRYAVPSIFPSLSNAVVSSPPSTSKKRPAKTTLSNAVIKEKIPKMNEENISNSSRSEKDLRVENGDEQDMERLKQKLAVANEELERQKLSKEKMQKLIEGLRAENQTLKSKEFMAFNKIKNECNLVKYYTGFENKAAYGDFLQILETQARTETDSPFQINHHDDDALSAKDALFLTLVRLNLGVAPVELARNFGISVESVNRIFRTWSSFLDNVSRQFVHVFPIIIIDKLLQLEHHV